MTKYFEGSVEECISFMINNDKGKFEKLGKPYSYYEKCSVGICNNKRDYVYKPSIKRRFIIWIKGRSLSPFTPKCCQKCLKGYSRYLHYRLNDFKKVN